MVIFKNTRKVSQLSRFYGIPGRPISEKSFSTRLGPIKPSWGLLAAHKELSSSSTTQSGHHLQTVQTTAEGTPFSGRMNTMALCDFDMRRLRRTLTYFHAYVHTHGIHVQRSSSTRLYIAHRRQKLYRSTHSVPVTQPYPPMSCLEFPCLVMSRVS